MLFSNKPLEFDSIKRQLFKYALSDTSRVAIENLTMSSNLGEVKLMLEETNAALNLIVKYGKTPLIENYDIETIKSFRDIRRSFTLEELLGIKLFLTMEREFQAYVKQIKETNNIIVNDYLKKLTSHNKLFNEFNVIFNNYGEINDNATKELFSIRKNLYNLNNNLNAKMQKLLETYSSYLSEKVVVTRNNRYCLAVKETYKNKIKGVIHDVSASGQTVFIEPEASLKITAEIELNKLEEAKEINKIIATLTNKVILEIETLKVNLNTYVIIDILSSKALYAINIDGIMPNINDEGLINLVNAKHPLLKKSEAVPISLSLNKNENMLLITGPNTGGKTVALKTVGLLSMMVQSGLLVPVGPESTFNIFTQIFADIGDEQSIENSLSTFSSHMSKIVKMLNTLSDNTLILLDEIGSGTDPNEGVALAIALIEAFMKYDVRLIVTSHYSELKNYAYESKGIKTASVAFDKESLKPLYYLQHGISGESHARLIASRLGIDGEIIKRADELFIDRQTDLAKIMSKLNDERLELDLKQNDLKNEVLKYEDAKSKYDKAYEKLLNEQEATLKQISLQEQAKWLKATKEIEKLITELESNQLVKEHNIANIKGKIRNQPESIKIKSDELINIGDKVLIKSYQQYGDVVDIKDNKYRVVFGLFDLEFKKEDLTLIIIQDKKETVNKVKKQRQSKDEVSKTGSMTVDLRGFRYEEVKEELDNHIDKAILSNLHSLTIIHGFGTGAVRKAVYEYINNSNYIKSHRLGKEGEGLNGVTIIELK